MENNNNNNFAILALVAIVAVIGVISLVMMAGGNGKTDVIETLVLIVDEAGNMVGQAPTGMMRDGALKELNTWFMRECLDLATLDQCIDIWIDIT